MRRAIGNGMRQINLLLIPSAGILLVLATPITRLIYQRGAFTSHSTELVATALFWFAVSLPFAGVNLLLTRTFFALQRPWIPTKLAAMNMIVDAILAAAAAAGATLTRPAAETFYGGYAGYFRDPDGHAWEVAHNPGFTLNDDGSLTLPDFSAG